MNGIVPLMVAAYVALSLYTYPIADIRIHLTDMCQKITICKETE